jgi:pyruvate formate lyase activating enzyme
MNPGKNDWSYTGMAMDPAPTAPLSETLSRLTREGSLCDALPGKAVRCYACGHDCFIPRGRPGVCKVRFNDDGVLRVPWGYVGALQIDPIEKKPFFHAFPGTDALSFGMLGCDLHCAYCQNWVTSQAIRDPAAVAPARAVTPAELTGLALRHAAPVMVSTYNEPLITSEWAIDVFAVARRAGIVTGYVSNGNGTERVLDALEPHLDLYKVDLKGFDDRAYRKLGGTLDAVKRTIASVHRRGLWLEVVTLLVPGMNDSDAELREAAGFLREISPDIPWHVTAFHRDYKMTGPLDTGAETLLRAAAIGRREGLRHVYAGNLPGQVGDLEDTRCAPCGETVVARHGFQVRAVNLTPAGTCRRCEAPLPGLWSVRARHPARPLSRSSPSRS